MYGCESWTIKKAKCWKIDALELWCWRRLLRVPWTTRRSNQSILKEISPEYSLEGLMLKLKLQYFGHLMWRTDSLEKFLMLGKIEGRMRRGQQKMRWHHWLNGHEFEQALGDGEAQGRLVCCSPWGHKESNTTVTEQPPDIKEQEPRGALGAWFLLQQRTTAWVGPLQKAMEWAGPCWAVGLVATSVGPEGKSSNQD